MPAETMSVRVVVDMLGWSRGTVVGVTFLIQGCSLESVLLGSHWEASEGDKFMKREKCCRVSQLGAVGRGTPVGRF